MDVIHINLVALEAAPADLHVRADARRVMAAALGTVRHLPGLGEVLERFADVDFADAIPARRVNEPSAELQVRVGGRL